MSTQKAGERPIRATAPRPGAAMRTAYLGAAEALSLRPRRCRHRLRIPDLRLRPVALHARAPSRADALPGLGSRLAAAGVLTMVGLQRLDDLQRCVESVVADRVEGDLIEVGTWRGGASILMRATLDSLGDDERIVWLADSFEGFPAADHESFPEDAEADDLSSNGFLAAPLDQVQDYFRRFGASGGSSSCPGSSARRCPDCGAGAGRSCASTATPTNRRAGA